MKQLLPPFFKHIITLLLTLCVINLTSQAQSIVIDSIFTTDAEIFPFGSNDTLYSLKISGSIVLNSDTSLVRLIFIDGDYNEYLLYEAYPYICDSTNFSISNVSDETNYLNISQPNSIYIHAVNASIELVSLHYTTAPVDFADSLQLLHKQDIEAQKIASINANIEKHEMIWFADETSVSHLCYAKKKALFGDSYNMLGFEYYAGGIYDPIPGAGEKDTDLLVPKFDWRNRHGANDPNKVDFYYDDDPHGGGWLTAVQNQRDHPECTGLCYIYAPIASLEGMVNVYLNKHKNFDLSEQHVLECDTYTSSNESTYGFASITDFFMKNTGVVSNNSYTPPGPPGSCQPISNPEYHIKIPLGTAVLNTTIEGKKNSIILRGPHTAWMQVYGSSSTNHFMSLVGYGILQVGDEYHGSNLGQNYIVEEGDNYEGTLYWIYKNSYGVGWGDNGYMYHVEDQWIPQQLTYYNLPFEDLVDSNTYEIACCDKDKDGYYNWGISDEKPGTCPSYPNDKDSDDSEPRIGPFDDYYFGVSVKPEMSVHKGPFAEIPNGGFYTFNTLSTLQTFEITVKNPGDAQLNFIPYGFPTLYGKVSISGPDSSHFTYNEDLPLALKMNGDTAFSITYDGLCSGSATCIVTIHLNECDMDDFVFAIVYADCDHSPTNQTISGTETWSGWRVINDNYKIEHGGKLTISGHVGFTDQANFIIAKGGEVIIDGGLLINACSYTWKGIDVWGDASLSQYPSSNQGYLRIINGGCIENAEAGVQLTRMVNGLKWNNHNGGIIRCDSALFKNNKADVIFYSYNNFDPNNYVKVPNRSSFTNTQFINNQLCRKDSCVFLQNVDGIIFRGCTFKNAVDKTSCPFTYSKEKGILSFNSGFYVDDLCLLNVIPCDSSRPCTFENLEYGVYALNAKFNEIISIDAAIFLNTYRGVYLNLISYPEVIRNQFIYDEKYDLLADYEESYGLDLEYCRNFIVEENIFTNTSSASEMLGLQVLNAGPYAHEIYNNSFSGFFTGITAAGENRNGTGEGLCLKCNNFMECETDIYITPLGGFVLANKGIQKLQGEANTLPDGPASNTFTSNDYPDLSNNIVNSTSNLIDYAHHINDGDIKLEPSPITIGVGLDEDDEAEYSKQQSCPSSLGGGINIQTEFMTLSIEASQIAAYEDTLNQFVDGGNTDGLNLEVQTSFPNEAMQLRQELLNESPYLSDTVMETAINKENVLPNVMIRDILVANPQSAKSAEVLNTLDDRFTPMPDYMMAEIMQGQYTMGAKELLEQKLSGHNTKRSNAYSRLVRHYVQDTINAWVFDSLASLLNNESSPGPRYELAFLYLDYGDSISMQNTLDNIPLEFDLSDKEKITHDLYIDYFDVLNELYIDSLNIIDSVQQMALMEIAENINLLPGIYARNLLINYGVVSYEETVYLPESLKHSPIYESPNLPITRSQKLIKVYPNPASSYFIIEYDLRETFGEAFIFISDLNGRIIDNFALEDRQNQRLVSTDPFSPGLYIIQLFINSELREAHKLQIVN